MILHETACLGERWEVNCIHRTAFPNNFHNYLVLLGIIYNIFKYCFPAFYHLYGLKILFFIKWRQFASVKLNLAQRICLVQDAVQAHFRDVRLTWNSSKILAGCARFQFLYQEVFLTIWNMSMISCFIGLAWKSCIMWNIAWVWYWTPYFTIKELGEHDIATVKNTVINHLTDDESHPQLQTSLCRRGCSNIGSKKNNYVYLFQFIYAVEASRKASGRFCHFELCLDWAACNF